MRFGLNRKLALVGAFVVGFSMQSRAQQSSVNTSTLKKESSSSRGGSSSLRAEMGYQFSQYGEDSEQSNLEQSNEMNLSLKGEGTGSLFLGRADVSVSKDWNTQASSLMLNEVWTGAYRKRESGRDQFSVGRMRADWSEVDQNWRLGMWEPRFNQDLIRPVPQGLTGFFVQSQTGRFDFLAYASPVFLPTTDPTVVERNGRLVPTSRWTRSTSADADVLGRRTKLNYSLSIPELNQITGKPGAGARLRWGDRKKGPFATTQFARKPINTLFLEYDYNLAVRGSNVQVETEVRPVVMYHRLWGADLGWTWGKSQLSMSYLKDEPETSLPEDQRDESGSRVTDRIRQQPGSISLWAAHFDQKVGLGDSIDEATLSVDYLKANEERTVDRDERGQVRGAILPNRLEFTNALSLGLSVPTLIQRKAVLAEAKFTRDFDQRGSLFSLLAKAEVVSGWWAHSGVDVLGVDEGVPDSDTGFLNQFRANDRVFLGVSHVF